MKRWISLTLSARLKISVEIFWDFGKTCLHEDMQILRHVSMLAHQIDTLLYLFTPSIYTFYLFIWSFYPKILLHFHKFTQIFSKLLRYDNSLISFDLMFKCYFLKDLWLIMFLRHILYFCSMLWFLQHTLALSKS